VTFLAKVRKRPKLVLFGHKYTQGSRDGFRGEPSPPPPPPPASTLFFDRMRQHPGSWIHPWDHI